MEDEANVTEELIANLTKAHTKQMELIIKATTKSMKEMMNLMKASVKNPTTATSDEKKKKWEEKQKKFRDAPICKHCNKKHPLKQESECWELKTNASSCPTNWKSAKSN
jgi:hypothetical protein